MKQALPLQVLRLQDLLVTVTTQAFAILLGENKFTAMSSRETPGNSAVSTGSAKLLAILQSESWV